jgi:uncharacterized membrane protein
MWFWLSLIALLCWSGSDLFSKIGCRDADDKLAHLKMVIAVGVVMGLHAAYEIFIGGVSISWHVIWTYLPVSLLYIVSMALGYIGLRYIELSISSPICNASGAVVAVLYLCFGGLCAAVYLFAKTPAFALSWWLSGLSYDALHGVGNFVLMLLLYRPLRRALQMAKKQLRV